MFYKNQGDLDKCIFDKKRGKDDTLNITPVILLNCSTVFVECLHAM